MLVNEIKAGVDQSFRIFIFFYNYDGVLYTRWRPPQWRIASLGGGHRLGYGSN